MVELNQEILNNEKAQERLKQLFDEQHTQYIDCLYNLSFIPARLKATREQIETEKDEDIKRQLQAIILKNEKDLEANKQWMKQYEETIPYFKSLIK
jgi:F0F1-type ATP synthase membrane subunit b/b'